MNQSPDTSEQKPKPTLEEQLELAAFEKFHKGVREMFGKGIHAINAEQFKHAVEKVRQDMVEAGEHSIDAIGKAAKTLQKDFVSSANSMRPHLDEWGQETSKAFDSMRAKGGALWSEISQESEKNLTAWRDRSGAMLAEMAKSVGDWSQSFGKRMDEMLIYRTGEATHGGTFACTDCGTEMTLKRSGHLPPCPKCHKTEFHRA